MFPLKLCNYMSYFVLQELLIFWLKFSLLDCSVQLDQASLSSVMFAKSIYFCIFLGDSDSSWTVPPKLIKVKFPFFMSKQNLNTSILVNFVTLDRQKIVHFAGSVKFGWLEHIFFMLWGSRLDVFLQKFRTISAQLFKMRSTLHVKGSDWFANNRNSPQGLIGWGMKLVACKCAEI